MAVAVANALLLTDGDAAFLRVNNRAPAHALAPGEVAAATNCRFEQGKPGPRYGVAQDPWGLPNPNLVTLAYAPIGANINGVTYAFRAVSGLVVGETYVFTKGNGISIVANAVSDPLSPAAITSGRFVATETLYIIYAADGSQTQTVTATVRRVANTCAYKRFSDPMTNSDQTILLTDDWRDGAGEDGGRGRAWRIKPGNTPQAIPLNGHDIWGTARLVQCDAAMLLLRHGNERHYFGPADIDATADTITLHTIPSWVASGGASSARVRFEPATPGAAIYGSAPPAAGNYYFASHTGSAVLSLYTDAALTNKLLFDASPAPVGKFYLELAADPVPFYGNGAPNLIMQPSAGGSTAFEAGFIALPKEIFETGVASNVITAANHRFSPGESITGIASELKESTGPDVFITWPKYVAPVDAHRFKLYTSAAAALVNNGTTGLQAVLAGQTGKMLWRTSAARAPLPSCREGAYENGRFTGILQIGNDLTVVSDPYDPLHATLWSSIIPANQGEAGRANWIIPLGNGVMAVGKDQNVIGIAGLSGPSSGWTERNITREYNGVSALCAFQVGTDVWFWSRKGLASVIRTVAGETLGDRRPISQDIPADLADIDWAQTALICGETWNNRVFIGVPTKGQTNPRNNKLLVLNRNNGTLRVEQQIVAGDIAGGITDGHAQVDAWEGSWNGDLLIPYAFAKLTINGEERLTFATPDGLVCWLHDGRDDAGAAITSEIVTRGYFGGRPVLALKGKLNWDTFQPKVTVNLLTAGVNEEETLAGFDALEYDRTKYLVSGAADYDPATSTTAQFAAPHREDYSPTAEELTVARLDVHQNLTEPFRCRVRGTSPQLRITNEQGSLRLATVSMQAKPVGVSSTRES